MEGNQDESVHQRAMQAEWLLAECERLRAALSYAHLEWAQTDTAVKKMCEGCLSDFEINGDSHGVPMIEDIVESLIKKLVEARRA